MNAGIPSEAQRLRDIAEAKHRRIQVLEARIAAALNILPHDGNQGRVDRAVEHLVGRRDLA